MARGLLTVHMTKGDDESSYVVRARAPLDISCANAMALLTSRGGAAAFRDIRKYDTYESLGDEGVRVAYTAKWGFLKVPVTLHLLQRGLGTLTFTSSGGGVPTHGRWSFQETGPRSCIASLSQTLVPRGVAAWVPLGAVLRGRVRRAFEDLQNARGKTFVTA